LKGSHFQYGTSGFVMQIQASAKLLLPFKLPAARHGPLEFSTKPLLKRERRDSEANTDASKIDQPV
jgi:hypothetical protein